MAISYRFYNIDILFKFGLKDLQKLMKKQQQSTSNPDLIDTFPEINSEIINKNIANTDPKTIQDKLTKYDSLDSEERVNIVKNLHIMLQQLGEQGISFVKPLLNQIVKDKEQISKALISRMPEIIKYTQKHANFQQTMKTTLIPILNYYLNHVELDVKEQAGKQLGYIAHKLNDKDRGDFVLKHVIQMAHDDNNEDNRIVAVQLFSSMGECFGKNLCEQFIGLEMLSLGEDISFKVRKEAIKQLPIICRLVSKQFFNRLFKFYESKAYDNSNWAIRKACVDILLEMGELCAQPEKQKNLTQILLTLTKDNNKWVKISAYKVLGPFIYQLKNMKLNQKLLFQFCRMADNDINNLGRDNEIILNCAYNFPAVLLSVGRQRWETDLWRVYEKLLKCYDKKIRKILSESVHEIAKLVGQNYTEKYLFKVVDTFFKDKNDEIKLGVIKNMSQIMQVLSEKKRQTLIGVFEEFQKDQKKWRIRQCISKQLGKILQIYSPQIIFEYVVPILLKFCSDTVSIVREESARKVGDFIKKLSKEQGLMIGLIESVKAFGTSTKYTQRQCFIIMSEKLMDQNQLYKKQFLQILVGLADDKVVNVKLALAELVKKCISKGGELAKEEEFIKLKERLEVDSEEEVREVFLEQ